MFCFIYLFLIIKSGVLPIVYEDNFAHELVEGSNSYSCIPEPHLKLLSVSTLWNWSHFVLKLFCMGRWAWEVTVWKLKYFGWYLLGVSLTQSLPLE